MRAYVYGNSKLKDLINEIKRDYLKEIMDENLNSDDLGLFFKSLPKKIGKSLNRFLVLGTLAVSSQTERMSM